MQEQASQFSLPLILSIISVGISLTALCVSIASLTLQRWDKKARLRLGIEKAYVPSSERDSSGREILLPTFGFRVRVRNLTERKIKIESVYLHANKRFQLPVTWKNIGEIPPHESKTLDINITTLLKWCKDVKILNPEQGRLVLVDGQGKEYKTERIKPYLSTEPITENELPK